jgi:hypothetical protein
MDSFRMVPYTTPITVSPLPTGTFRNPIGEFVDVPSRDSVVS